MLARLGGHKTLDGRRLGEWPVATITEDVVEGFYAELVTAGRAASTRNHYVTIMKALFRWASRKGAITRSPLSADSSLRRSKTAQRRRRVSPDEERALLAAADDLTRGAGPRLQWIIIAALETGARLGELLALQWAD